MLAWDKDNEVANLIREELVLPFLTGDFHPDFMPEYAGSVLFALMTLLSAHCEPFGHGY